MFKTAKFSNNQENTGYNSNSNDTVTNGQQKNDGLDDDGGNEQHTESKVQVMSLEGQTMDEEWAKAREFHETLASSDSNFKVLGYSPVADFHGNLETYLGPPKMLLYEAMEMEHCESTDSDVYFESSGYGLKTTSRIEWNIVVDPSENGLQKVGLKEWPSEAFSYHKSRRQPRPLDDFERPLIEINARLRRMGLPSMTMIELIACRIYTGPMGTKYQKMIRTYTAGKYQGQEWRFEEERRMCMGNKYPTTIHVIQSAIAKLGKINPSQKGYSGLEAMLLPERFWDDHPDLNAKGGVEGAFMSLSTNRDVAVYYASKKKQKQEQKFGVLLEVDMSTMDRGAEVSWLAQYPHEEEILLPPLTHLHVKHIRLDSSTKTPLMVVEVQTRINQSIRVHQPILSDAENAIMRQVVRGKDDPTVMMNSKLLSRFSDEENFLITGNPMESVLGLSYFLGVEDDHIQSKKMDGLQAIENEILASKEQELISNFNYVLYEVASEQQFSNGIRDLNNSGKKFDDFANHTTAKKYNLKKEHVAALRLYTTSAFKFLNGPLRNSQQKQKGMDKKKPHPFPVTVSFIDEGIKRLRASTANSFATSTATSTSTVPTDHNGGELCLWRGMKNTRIEEHFLEGRHGGTELGLMSTTKDLKIAVQYSQSLEGNALLFKFKVDNMKQLGADLSWLSAFPSEGEVLYPPLTFLQPTGKVETTSISGMLFTIVEIQPHL